MQTEDNFQTKAEKDAFLQGYLDQLLTDSGSKAGQYNTEAERIAYMKGYRALQG